jgi:hypothetical protein
MVWDEAIKTMESLFVDVWGPQEVVTVNHCADLALPVRALPLSQTSPNYLMGFF